MFGVGSVAAMMCTQTAHQALEKRKKWRKSGNFQALGVPHGCTYLVGAFRLKWLIIWFKTYLRLITYLHIRREIRRKNQPEPNYGVFSDEKTPQNRHFFKIRWYSHRYNFSAFAVQYMILKCVIDMYNSSHWTKGPLQYVHPNGTPSAWKFWKSRKWEIFQAIGVPFGCTYWVGGVAPNHPKMISVT